MAEKNARRRTSQAEALAHIREGETFAVNLPVFGQVEIPRPEVLAYYGGLAVLAAAHGIPFYVAAPSSTFDPTLSTGDAIPIEQRDPREVTHGFGRQTAPEGIDVYNPAFDVTPARLIAAIICEHGVFRPPFAELRTPRQ